MSNEKKNKEKKQHVARCLSDKNNLITFKLRFPSRKQGESTPQENWNVQEIYKSQLGNLKQNFLLTHFNLTKLYNIFEQFS